MPFVGNPNWRPSDFRVWWMVGRERVRCEVTWSEGHHNFVARVGDAEHGMDRLDDLLKVAPTGAVVHCAFGMVELEMKRGDSPTSCLARASTIRRGERVSTEFEGTPELALKRLGELDATRECPRCCFWCANSDYETGTGFEDRCHLACFLTDKDQYAELATSEDMRKRKWALLQLRYAWVDEFFSCDHWERRPPGHGYRG